MYILHKNRGLHHICTEEVNLTQLNQNRYNTKSAYCWN